MSLKTYLKRGIKYVVKEYNPPIVKAEIVQKTPNDIFKEKVIMITGGGSGLGYYMAKKLNEEGAIVIITGRNEEKLKIACEQMGKNTTYFVGDVSDIKSGKKIIDKIYEQYGKMDVLINNAGISYHEGNILKVTEEKFDKQFSTNLKGSYFLSQNYIRKVKENKAQGNIIFISSERGSQCDDLPYGLTKVAINSLTQGLSRRFYKDGIRVNAVAPGVTASDMTGIKKEENLYSENASGRFFIPEEVAEVVLFLVSDYSKSISGEIIHCNAGQHLQLGYK